MSENIRTLAQVLEQEKKLEIEKAIAYDKAMNSGDVEQVFQAQQYAKNIDERQAVDIKSVLIDPMQMTTNFGYKEKPFQFSYEVLRAMSRTHIIKAIIETRKEQVLNFCEPQKDKYSVGFVIEKKNKYITAINEQTQLTKLDQSKIEWLVEFLLGCGTTSNFWHADTFETFIGKIVTDSLTLDQATFEIVRNLKGDPIEFFATDAATYRVADTYNDDEYHTRHPEKIINGYAPTYVQLIDGQVRNEFYPWELCFGVRNPQTSIMSNGYGRSELEDMIGTITSILNSDNYNSNFFKVGAAPKGIIRYSGNIGQNTVEEFRRQWQTQVAGASNAHKVPIINADKMDFINTNVPNKDMEFSKFQEFLIKISCAQYKIDPSEIGFPMSGNESGSNGLGGSDQEEKVKYSKDKGLKPLLKKIQYWINKYIVFPVDDDFIFKFVGIDDEKDEQTELDRDISQVTNFTTLNEIRAKRNLPPLPHGDMPLNPVYAQAVMMQQQQEMMAQQGVATEKGEQTEEIEKKNDPFIRNINAELEKLLVDE